MSQSSDYRPDSQDGFTREEELAYQEMVAQDQDLITELGVDGDYAGYDAYLDESDFFPNIPNDEQEYGDAFSVAEYCYGWDGE